MKLRVLACAYACLFESGVRIKGGEAILGWNLVQQLARFHDVWVLTSAQNRASIELALRQEPLPRVRFHYLDLPRWLEPMQRYQGSVQLYAYCWQVKAYFVARRLHQQFRFDAFQHITYANDWMASFIGALLPIPFIRGPGGGAHQTPKTMLGEYSLRSRLWERLRRSGQWLFRHDPFFFIGQRRARAILVCNREAFEAIPQELRSKAFLFPVNGVSESGLTLNVPRGQVGGKFRILSAGKLLPLKGFTLVIRAFKAFVERQAVNRPGAHAELTIVGEGPERSRLEALVDQLELQKQVRFEEWMLHEQLLQKMVSCDVFLFPSLRDGGGAVVVEAMAAGKPVICLDVAGPGMHVTIGCGIKVAPKSPEWVVSQMAIALERLYSDGELRLKMGRAARERAKSEYYWDRLGERLVEIYKGVSHIHG